MQREILYGMIGVFIGYIILRYFLRIHKSQDLYTEIVQKDEYKVKGQWDK